MEIDKRIKKRDSNGLCHGYWEDYHDRVDMIIWYKVHYLNGNEVGYRLENYENNKVCRKHHFLNGNNIGCMQRYTTQFFYDKLNKKFGEEIEWK